MLNLNSALISRSIKLIGALSGASGETIEWVTHYALGTKETKHLPECLMEESRSEVLFRINHKFQLLLRKPQGTWTPSLVGRLGGCPIEGQWWKDTGSSVVGCFNFKVVFDYDNEKLQVFCEDTWDFNGGSHLFGKTDYLMAKLPKAMIVPISKLLTKLHVPHEVLDEQIRIPEDKLAMFNKDHAFKTVWGHEFDFSEFDFNPHEYIAKGSYILRRKTNIVPTFINAMDTNDNDDNDNDGWDCF